MAAVLQKIRRAPCALASVMLLCISGTWTPLGFSQSSTSTPNPDTNETLPTLSIEAEAVAPVGAVEHADFAGRYTRIHALELERGDAHLGEVLSFEAGIQQRQIGGFGSFSSVSVRASTPAQTGVFLDGIRLNGAANAVINFATLDVLSLDSVDVYRGAAPLQPLQTQLTHRSNHDAWHSVNALQIGASDNNFAFTNDNTTPLNKADDKIQRRNNAGVRSVALFSKLGYQHDNNRSSDVLLQHSQRELGVPEWRNASVNQAAYRDGRGQLHLSHRRSSTSGWNQRHTAFLHWSSDHYDDRLDQVGVGRQDYRSQQRVQGASTYWDRFTNSGKWALSAELRRDAFDSNDPLARVRFVNANRRSFTAGLAYTWFAVNDRLLLTPRLRAEQHNSAWTGIDVQPDASDSRLITNPELSVRFNQSKTLQWTASIGQYYRVPTFSEMFGSQGLLIGNANLVPESGVNAEIGAQWQVNRKLNVLATLFHSERDDLIAPTYDSQGIGRHTNIGKARIRGVELEAQWAPVKRLTIRANLTRQEAVNLSDIPLFFNKQVPGPAAISADVRATFDVTSNVQLWGEANLAKDRFYDRGNLLRSPNSTLTSVGVQWAHKFWRAQVHVNNLSDLNVEDFNGFPRPGRAFHIGVSRSIR